MIDSKFIIRYTDALYSTPPEYAPRYDEFRDMFSSGQIRSKEWLIHCLGNLYLDETESILVTGAWFGTLGILLNERFPFSTVKMIDIDPRCEQFINRVSYNIPNVLAETCDMYEYDYKEDIIINTSCEHIPDLQEWLKIIPSGKIVILQSNNYMSGNGHVNCVKSIEEFEEKANLQEVIFKGKLTMPMYTRFMLIGST